MAIINDIIPHSTAPQTHTQTLHAWMEEEDKQRIDPGRVK
jgi:hypothetical protein